jgi:hypothetical protein
MRSKLLSNLIRLAAITSLGLTTIVATNVATPGVALAASNHAASGETWSSAFEWYRSTNVRVKAGTGRVSVNLSVMPCWISGATGQCGQWDTMKWQLINSSGGVISGSYRTGILQGQSQTIIGSLANGTQFRNEFARGLSCFTQCRHTFSGTQYY